MAASIKGATAPATARVATPERLALVPGAMPGDALCRPDPELKANILIVDDRPDKLLALESILSSLGQNLVKARSGKEALRHLLKQNFAAILLDVSMPGMDGFETAAMIRQRQSSEHTPIIFVTSISNNENHISRGYSLGAVDYLLTPIVPEILRAKVSVFVELHRQTELSRLQAEQLRLMEESRHRQQLAEIENRLETETRRNRFFMLALDMLAIASFDGSLLQVNRSWERVLGFGPEDLAGRNLGEVVHPLDRAAFDAALQQLHLAPTPAQFDCRSLSKNGSTHWLQCTLAPFQAENLIYVFARDITATKTAEAQVSHLHAELQNRVAELLEANRELEAFNYSIAHDLRTPLRSMAGFAKALLDDETQGLSPQGADYTRRIWRSAKYMDSLLLDLLAYSRLARAEMPPALVDLDDAVSEQIAMMEKELQDCRAQVQVASPLGAVRAHLPTLNQILSNLIGNAAKFVAPGQIPQIRIFSRRNQGTIRLWVEDNGIGVPAEHQEKIFGLFQRLHDNQKYPGTGIGLALVRKGAERMGGRAGVESSAGQGCRFWVELPAGGKT